MVARGKNFAKRWEELAIDDTLQVATEATITPNSMLGGPTAPPSVPAQDTLSLPLLAMVWPEGSPPDLSSSVRADIAVGELIGAGGMGEIRSGQQHSLQREVAIKTLRANAMAKLADSLVREALLTGYLAHPGVIPVHALGRDDRGSPVLVMKRIRGASWMELLRDPQHASWSLLEERTGDRLLANLAILSQVCDAVAFAHDRGVIHRDIKPENVMVGAFGEVYLVDWGVARRRGDPHTRELLGTPAYMAPEMVQGEPADERTDVYLLGATLHAVLTGRPRHAGATLREILRNADISAPVTYPSSVPEPLAALCNRATAADPAQRPASVKEFRAGISDYLAHRNSLSLSEAALARLSDSDEFTGESTQEERALRAFSRVAEARFGFTQALRDWKDNPQAKAGLARCTRIEIELHLQRRDPAAARILLRSLPEAKEQFEDRIRALEQAAQHEHLERERLRKMDRDMDSSVGRIGRLWAFIVLGAVTAATLVYVSLQEGGPGAVTHEQTVAIAALCWVGTILVVIFKRKQVMANRFSRRFMNTAMALLGTLLFGRLLAWSLDMPLQHVFVMDGVMMTGVGLAATILLKRWIAIMAICPIVASTAITFAAPSLAALIFSVGSAVAIAAGTLFWRR